MLRPLILLIIFNFYFPPVHAQKKYINRKIAQKNYDGYMLMTEKKYNEALIIFNEALKEDTEAFFIYQNRALCKLQLKDTLGAIEDFQTNIEMEPANSESKYALGNIYKTRKDSANAIKYFVPAIAQADEEFSQKKLLYMSNFSGHYFRLHEDYDSALVFYNKVKRFTPNNPSVYINSAVCNYYIDSIANFCSDLEKAFVLGGNVNCIALKNLCNGCTHLLSERGNTDTLSTLLDTRLANIIPDTIYYHSFQKKSGNIVRVEDDRKVKVYFNKLWQLCLPEEASFYREAFWSPYKNYFGGAFTDYYVGGKIYAEGRIHSTNVTGLYKSYYPNGNLKLKAHFTKSIPSGVWTYYLEDGTPDTEVTFRQNDFEIRILNDKNPNLPINSGSGKFNVLLDKWDDLEFVISGEFENKKRAGQWAYIQDGEKLIVEKYKKGKFRNGHILTNIGTRSTSESVINTQIFIPPQITQVRNLNFYSNEAINYYSFIRKFGR